MQIVSSRLALCALPCAATSAMFSATYARIRRVDQPPTRRAGHVYYRTAPSSSPISTPEPKSPGPDSESYDKKLSQISLKMSQEQPRRPGEEEERRRQLPGVEPIKYGDVFSVSGELAAKPIAPQDAAMMQSAEAAVFGQPQKGGPADAMQAAAAWNERAGLVRPGDRTEAVEEGITVTETGVPSGRIVTESVAGQVVAQYVEGVPPTAETQVQVAQQSAITIGEALEAAARSAKDKPVDRGDAAAIFAAEQCVTGRDVVIPGGLAASAQTAAAYNEGTLRDDAKIKLSDVLTGAPTKLPADRAASRPDAEWVVNAELRNGGKTTAHAGGVAASVAAAARLNEGITNP